MNYATHLAADIRSFLGRSASYSNEVGTLLLRAIRALEHLASESALRQAETDRLRAKFFGDEP